MTHESIPTALISSQLGTVINYDLDHFNPNLSNDPVRHTFQNNENSKSRFMVSLSGMIEFDIKNLYSNIKRKRIDLEHILFFRKF